MGVSGIRIRLEFRGSNSLGPETRGAVLDAFAAEGLRVDGVDDLTSPLEDTSSRPEAKGSGPSLRVHILAKMRAREAIEKVGRPAARAVTAVRIRSLRSILAFEAYDRAVGLAFRADDDPAQVDVAMDRLPSVFSSRETALGWDRARLAWVDLLKREPG